MKQNYGHINKFLVGAMLGLTLVGTAVYSTAFAQTGTTDTSGNGQTVQAGQTDNRFRGRAGRGPMMNMENVERTVTNLDNGVQVTMTSTDTDTITKLQEMEANRPTDAGQGKCFGAALENVERTVTNLDNGIQITMTSTDADTVTRLQEMEANRGEGPGPRIDMQNVTRTVTNLDNGVQITLTSNDAETVTLLQEREQNPERHGPGPMAAPARDDSQQ